MSSGLRLSTSLTSKSTPISTEIFIFFWGLDFLSSSFSSSLASAALPSSDFSDVSASFSACLMRSNNVKGADFTLLCKFFTSHNYLSHQKSFKRETCDIIAKKCTSIKKTQIKSSFLTWGSSLSETSSDFVSSVWGSSLLFSAWLCSSVSDCSWAASSVFLIASSWSFPASGGTSSSSWNQTWL